MTYINLLEKYNELKASKGNLDELVRLRVEILNAMYEDMEDFKTSNQVNILLNEELSYFRKLRRAGTKICSKEMTCSYVLYRYLVENGDSPDRLKFDFKQVEIDEINQRLVESVSEYNLLEYFTHKFAHVNHSERICSLMYHSLLQINRVLGIEGSMALSERPVDEVLKILSEDSHYNLTQSDNFFKETNEQGYAFLEENDSIKLATALFILNFEKGNKAYALFYLEKLYKLFDEKSPIMTLVNYPPLEPSDIEVGLLGKPKTSTCRF